MNSASTHTSPATITQNYEPLALFSDVLTREAQALNNLVAAVPRETSRLIDTILHTTGSVIFTGAGKSGHIGKKLAATFSSLGISSLFIHPFEALHGDFGVIKKHDCVIMLSKSASGYELELLALLLRQHSVTTILICCEQGSLCSDVSLAIQLPFENEACLLNLAPTSSSTLMLAFGDALASTISFYKGFTASDFARNHPSGSLGKSLLLTTASLMHAGKQLPLLDVHDSFTYVITTIMEKKLGVGIVVNAEQNVLGIITDGDIRRACALHGPAVFSLTAKNLMTVEPKTVSYTTKASQALAIMEQYNITKLVVTDEHNHTIGLLHINALIKAGIRKDI